MRPEPRSSIRVRWIGLPAVAAILLVACGLDSPLRAGDENPQPDQPSVVALPDWRPDGASQATPVVMDAEAASYQTWGAGTQRRWYADELLPACFERTLAIDRLDGKGPLQWIFTGPRAGLTVVVAADRIRVSWRAYDSPAFNDVRGGKPPRHPEWQSPERVFALNGSLRSVTVRIDHKLGLSVLANGRELLGQTWLADLSRHQLRLTEPQDSFHGKLLRPEARKVGVQVDPARRHQTMLGFGGIATPTAYAMLSPEGKRRWWQMVAEYNLLLQREYPIGLRLNPAMDNWDRPADATPHYYGDNFPNGETSDFEYLKRLRELGGKVIFEFWALPPWGQRGRGKPLDTDKYVQAMVGYCQVCRDRTGTPPEIVGIQNEVQQTPEDFHRMTLALRRGLDAAGFGGVRIHMSDDSSLRGGVKRSKAFVASPDVWKAIDYSATHMYDFQNCFTRPDEFDSLLLEWTRLTGDKPFLSTELCVNSGAYQVDSYRLALSMGQLYHKNLVLTDAVAICYCWTLLNVVQPSYGATRSLCVPDEAGGGMPVASSHQLRVFGAYSRRVREGMTRVDTACDDPDLLVSAFAGDGGRATLVALNRSARPAVVRVLWPGARWTHLETAGPYHPNASQPSPTAAADGTVEVCIEPGDVVTLTSVDLPARQRD